MSFVELCNQVFNQAIRDYHVTDNIDTPINNPYERDSIENRLYLKCWIDTVQWHFEDIIRDPHIDPIEALALKRRIDRSNQDRTDLVEQIDSYFRQKYSDVNVLPDARINTESPAWAIDRLSILTLKIYHMKEQAERTDASDDHRQKCQTKLNVLLEQQVDLGTAIDQLLEGKMPDMVIGGINHGDNSTVNNHYSGTMGIAKEGCMKYIPSIAFSSCYYNHDANFEPLSEYVRNIVSNVLANGLPRGVCLNVNFPAMQEFKGVKVCRMTFGRWINEVVKAHQPRGYDYYWMVGEYANDEPTAEDTDQWALSHGYVAITPTRIDVTAYEMIDTIKNWNL